MFPVEDAMVKQIAAEKRLKSLRDVKAASGESAFLRGREAEIMEWSSRPEYQALLDYLAAREAKGGCLIGLEWFLCFFSLLTVIPMVFIIAGVLAREKLLPPDARIGGWVVFACVLPLWFVTSYLVGTRADRRHKRRLIAIKEKAKDTVVKTTTPSGLFFEQLLKTALDDLLECEDAVKKAPDYGGCSKRCDTCRRVVSVNRYAGMKCPYCGVHWDTMETGR